MPTGEARYVVNAGTLPAAPGAYALALDLRRPVAVATARLGTAMVPAGRYLYCGSARGAGGLRARVARHMRRDKAVRWHIDQLTMRSTPTGVFVIQEGRECVLVQCLLELSGVAAPLAGFGASDCRTCPAHLVTWPPGLGRDALLRRLAG
ncbi:MAG: DUF123 domain-containing protein [Alphaproteobacteria bacterium]